MQKWIVCSAFLLAGTAFGGIPSSQRDGLVALYDATAGATWIRSDGWRGAAGTECSWYGVKCNNSQTAVTELALAENNLTGTIPAAAAQLVDLEILDLTTNHLTGSFPEVLTTLPKLRELWLAVNDFEGAIPPSVGAMSTLECLDLGRNRFSGSIPRELAGLTRLRILGLYTNDLSGDVPPELWRMTSLVELWLTGNKLTGSIPADVGSLVNLEYLVLWDNMFSGPIPVELADLPKLRVLSAAYNTLTGPIPPELGRLTDLEIFSFGDNLLSGTIPANLGDLTRLTYFDVAGNDFEGVLPATLGKLTSLETLNLRGNRFSGPIPQWIAGMPRLTFLGLSDNQFTGNVPDFFWTLENLESLSFGVNRVTGSIPPQVRNLKKLQLLTFHFTAMSGPLPPEIGELASLQYLFASGSGLSGRVPPQVGNLSNLLLLDAWGNDLEGPLPPEIGNLLNLEELDLHGNRLSGPIPRDIGNLPKIQDLELHDNALRGVIPREITKLTSLRDKGGLFIDHNALVVDDPAVLAFIEQKTLFGSDTMKMQTLAPGGLHVVGATDRTVTLGWDFPKYYFRGTNQVVARTSAGGAAAIVASTQDLFESQMTVRNLAPETTYYFTVTAITYPWLSQKNLIASDSSAPVSATTGARVLAGPDIQLTEAPTGLIQVSGVPRNENHFTLTNIGDKPSLIQLDWTKTFAILEPLQFTLEAGASQTVTVRSVPQPAGSYFGWVSVIGEGAVSMFLIHLLSAAEPQGFVRAEAVDSRIEVVGEPGFESFGNVRFRNVGTAMLEGMLVSDRPWVIPGEGGTSNRVLIPAGATAAANFRIDRSLRPAGVEGALAANLTLIYAENGEPPAARSASGTTSSGIATAKVTIIDITRPALSTSAIPAASGGQVSYFLTGLTSMLRGSNSFFSDVALVNQSGSGALRDVRLYYTPAGGQQTTVATLSPIAASQSLTLANIVTTVYGAPSQVGSIQVRCDDWQHLGVQAKLLGSSSAGTVSGDIPLFRSDRVLALNDELYLTGVARSATRRTELYIQETRGEPAGVRIEFLSPTGETIGIARTESVPAWGAIQIQDAAPEGAVTAVVRNAGTAGRIAAYARIFDEESGDNWSIVDWSRVQGFQLDEPLRVPFIDGGSPSTGGRRRAVSHSATSRATTDLTLFNPSDEDVIAVVRVVDTTGKSTDREVRIAPKHTVNISGMGSNARTSTAQATILPLYGGHLVASARSCVRSIGSAIPIVSAGNGLVAGQSMIFSSLEDSTSAAIAAALPGTYRTSFGLSETGAGSVVVRARVVLDEGRSIFSTVFYRDFSLSAGQQIVTDEIVRALVGTSRDTRFGDLHGFQLRVEVLSGDGSVVPFVIITDNASGDSLLRLQ